MTNQAAVVIHRALIAMHGGQTARLAAQLHPEVVYDTGQVRISGRDAVAAAITAPQFENLTAEFVPGSVESYGDYFIAHTVTVLRWREGGERADAIPTAFAIYVHNGLITRVTHSGVTTERRERDASEPNVAIDNTDAAKPRRPA